MLLLNPDAVLHPGAVAVRCRSDWPPMRGWRASGPGRWTRPDGSAGRLAVPWTPARSWIAALGISRALCLVFRRGPGRAGGDGQPGQGAERIDYAIGSVLLLRAEALEQVGGFDEDFFLYAEETDWAKRAALLGWRHTVVAEASALHTGAATSVDTAARDTHFAAGLERYLRKHHGAGGWPWPAPARSSGPRCVRSCSAGTEERVARARLRLLRTGLAARRTGAGPLAPPTPGERPMTTVWRVGYNGRSARRAWSLPWA